MEYYDKRTLQLIQIINNTPYEVGLSVGFADLQEKPHNEWLTEWLYGTNDITTQAHRGSYKTSTLALYIALHAIRYPHENLIFIRKTDTDVAEIIRLIYKIMTTSAFQEFCYALYGATVNIVRDTASEIETDIYRGGSGASQILGMGIGGSLTGKHADVVVTDDIVNVKDRVSRAERERTKLMYMELQNIKNRGGRIINTGTPWHKDDAFSLMPTPTGVFRWDCYQSEKVGLVTADDIKQLRSSMSASLYAANYELKHIADENAMFTDAKFTADTEQIYNGICHIDASYGGEDATAFTVIKETDNRLIVYGKKYQKHVDDVLTEILAKKKIYRAGTTWTERNADKGYLDKSLRQRGDISSTYHEKMNKHIKISTYLKENWGRVYFLNDTDPEYIAEILDYTETAAHDDCPDSLASAIRQLGKKPMALNREVKHGL